MVTKSKQEESQVKVDVVKFERGKNKNITVGLDIGSRSAKGVLLNNGTLFTAITPTGYIAQNTADIILRGLLKKSGIAESKIDYIVGTGYGRISLKFNDIPHQEVTEISCHAQGAHYLNPSTRTIIDIGGQDSKAIKVDSTGKVADFVLNDKCAAGTGKFLETIAGSLNLDIEEMGGFALRSTKPTQITSQCVVFAESEVISLKANSEKREDIAAGIHHAVARRVINLLNRVGIENDVVFTGGVSKNIGMKAAIEQQLGIHFIEPEIDATYAGALGAAVFAQKFALEKPKTDELVGSHVKLDIEKISNAIDEQQKKIIATAHNGKKTAGYFCLYTPVELADAAGVVPVRLFKGGDDNVSTSGEIHTRSFFCQFSRSCIGGFRENDPLYTSIDKLYTFNTCDQMKKVTDAISEFYKIPSQIFSLPREHNRTSAKELFHSEVQRFREDLEDLSGKKISDKSISEQIALRNLARKLLTQISDLRKRINPPITGTEFLEIAKAYYYLPPERLLPLYRELFERLSKVKDDGKKHIRFLMAGGIIADGDRKLLDLIEQELGARVVVEDHCTGLRPFYHQITENGNPIKSLSEGYLDQAPCARMKPIDERLKFTAKLAQEYKVDGILYNFLMFCNCYGMRKNLYVKHFQKLGIPALELPTDYSKSDLGQLKTRMEAFVELIERR